MPRIRTIKPDFFLHEGLAELPIMARMLFIGLWTQADRDGRLEDRPKRIKASLFPYDNCDVDKLLNDLADGGFIIRYKCDANRSVEDITPRAAGSELQLIQVVNFSKHQVCNVREQASTLPPPPCMVQVQYKHSTSTTGKEGKGTGSGKEVEQERESEGKPIAADAASDDFLIDMETESDMLQSLTDPPHEAPQTEAAKTPTLHELVIDSYSKFYEERNGIKPKIDAADGKAVKTMIAYLKTSSKSRDDEGAYRGWQYVLENWNKIEAFLQGQLKLTQINSNLVNILSQIKNGTPNGNGKYQTPKLTLSPNGVESNGRKPFGKL